MVFRSFQILFILFLLVLFLASYSSCEREDPIHKILRERKNYDVDLLSWAVVEGDTIIANIRLSGPIKGSLKHITVCFEQYDEDKNFIKKDWIPFNLSELEGIGAKEFTLSIECGGESVSQLVAMIDYEPAAEDMKDLKELEGLL